MRISTTNMHNLAVKWHNIMKVLSPYSAVHEINSPRNLKMLNLKTEKFNPLENLCHYGTKLYFE